MRKRFLSIMMALTLTLSLLPASALASEGGGTVVAKITAGEETTDYTSLKGAVNALNEIEGKEAVTMEIMPGKHDVTADKIRSESEKFYGSCFIIQRDNVTIKAADSKNKPILYGFTSELNDDVHPGKDGQKTTGQDTI